MSLGVIIATHGLSSVELLKSAEMIVGNQKNVETVTFNEGDGLDDLKESYSNALNKLKDSKDIVILVDIWGGSPFNVATELDCEVITGVNIPMLIELFMNKDNLELSKLVKVVLTAGHESIKSLSAVTNNLDDEEEF